MQTERHDPALFPRAAKPSQKALSGRAFRRLFGAALALVLGPLAGCERVPDFCEGYPLACLAVTVDSGPADVRRLRVNIMDGLESNTSTVQTPKKVPKAPLVYPLRFAIRFFEFDNLYKGQVTFDTIALNGDFDPIGEVKTVVPINGTEKKAVTITIGPLPDSPDDKPDMSTLPPNDAGGNTGDLAFSPDMP
jgi:hypothetical protein